MKILSTETDGAHVLLSIDELDALRNALNEASLLLQGRHGADFETRVGLSVADADRLLKELQALVGEIDVKGGRHYDELPETSEIKRKV